MSEQLDVLKAKLNQETARASWLELQPFFARGQTVYVDPGLDLIEVAVAFSEDDAARLQQWQSAGQVDKVSDDQARSWLDTDPDLWSVVVMPWVLIQPARS